MLVVARLDGFVEASTSSVLFERNERLHHPQVGDLDLHYELLHLPDSNGQRLLTHTAAGGGARRRMRWRCWVRVEWRTGRCHALPRSCRSTSL